MNMNNMNMNTLFRDEQIMHSEQVSECRFKFDIDIFVGVSNLFKKF